MRLPSNSLLPILAALSTMAICAPAYAADINWNSTIGSDNYTSTDDSPILMGEGFVFELGAFGDGFLPTSENMDEWADNWVALDRTVYNPNTKFFSSKARLASNGLPFHWSKKGYIWGFNQDNPGEWILATNGNWTWPFASGIQPPTTWSIGAPGTTTLVGDVNGPDFQMQTEAVSQDPPEVNPDAWKQQHFSAAERANPTISDWDADADNDGASNLFELAAGTNPKSAMSYPSPEVQIVDATSGSYALQVRLPRSHRAAINYSAESSGDLEAWSVTGLLVTSDDLGQIVLQFPMTSARQFVRLTFSL